MKGCNVPPAVVMSGGDGACILLNIAAVYNWVEISPISI